MPVQLHHQGLLFSDHCRLVLCSTCGSIIFNKTTVIPCSPFQPIGVDVGLIQSDAIIWQRNNLSVRLTSLVVRVLFLHLDSHYLEQTLRHAYKKVVCIPLIHSISVAFPIINTKHNYILNEDIGMHECTLDCPLPLTLARSSLRSRT